jgi:hypothetical protein
MGMSIFKNAFVQFTAASVIALQISASQAQDPASVPPQGAPFEQTDDAVLEIQRSSMLATIENNALVIGRDLQALKLYSYNSVQVEAAAEKKRATFELQEAINAYMTTRPDYYYEPIAVDGDFGHDTAAALLKIAEIEELKYLILDINELQSEQNTVPYRFLRNELKKLAPAEFVFALSGLAGQNERALHAANKREFSRCVSYDGRLFARTIVDTEIDNIIAEGRYISPYISDDCTPYLKGLPEYDFKTLQIEFLMTSTIVPPSGTKQEEEWCLVQGPDSIIGRRCVSLAL